jgi:hypothetical protein
MMTMTLQWKRRGPQSMNYLVLWFDAVVALGEKMPVGDQ